VDSLDWKGLNKQQVKKNIMKGVSPGAIVLQHAGGGTSSTLDGTVQAIPEIIQAIKKRGYKFVTLPELLHTSKAVIKKTAS
jgi:peptidoglycan/xylan/chitin deacetylase (PgdA/CDA1 family)